MYYLIERIDKPLLLNVEFVVKGKENNADDESTHDDLSDISEYIMSVNMNSSIGCQP